MKDFLNQDIQKGDYILYPRRSSSSLWLTVSKVIGFTGNYINVETLNGKKTKVSRIDYVVKMSKDQYSDYLLKRRSYV
jgi:hypothetical protein